MANHCKAKNRWSFLALWVVGMLPPLAIANSNLISISLNLEENTGSLQGQVELKDQKESRLLSFRGGRIRLEVMPGRYSFRIRSKDERGVPGEWGDFQELIVRPHKVKALDHGAESAVRASPKSGTALMALKWNSSKGAAEYRLTVISKEGTEILNKVIPEAHLEWPLPPGNYSWQVVAIAHTSYGEAIQSEPSERKEFTIRGPQLKRPQLTLQAKGQVVFENGLALKNETQGKGVALVLIEMKRHEGTIWRKVDTVTLPLLETLNVPSFAESGIYRFTVVAQAPFWEDSEAEQIELVRKPTRQDLSIFENRSGK